MIAARVHAGYAEDGSPAVAQDAPMDRTLAAVRRLTHASVALIAMIDSVTGATRVTSRSAGDPGTVRESDLLAAVVADSPAWTRGEPHWIDGHDDRPAVMTVELGFHASGRALLLLAFTRAGSMAQARVARLAPDLVQLINAQLEVDTRLEEARAQQAAATLALDHGMCGVIALRPDHSVLFANSAASAMLAEEDGLHLRRGLIRPSDYRYAVRFEAAVDAVLDASQGGATGKPPALMMLLPRGREGRPTIIVIAPASLPAAPGEPDARCALLYVLRPGPGLTRGVETLAQLHGLSRVETRLLAHLCGGMTVSESAGEMRIKLETARAYLKQIFAKTGTHRQAELVALMSRYLRAVRGDFDFRPA